MPGGRALRAAWPRLDQAVGVPLAAAAVAWAAASGRLWPLGPAALLVLLPGLRREGGLARLLLLVAGVVLAAGSLAPSSSSAGANPALVLEQRLAQAQARFRRIADDARDLARRAAASPAAATLRDPAPQARARLFDELEALRAGRDTALALYGPDLAPVAWSGHAGDLAAHRDVFTPRDDVFVVEGTLSASLFATAALKDAQGRTLGVAAAEVALAARRNLRNRFFDDFDRVTDGLPGAEAEYFDLREGAHAVHALPPPAPGRAFREAPLEAPDGDVIGQVRVSELPPHARGAGSGAGPIVTALLAFALAAWGYAGTGRSLSAPRAVAASLLMRGLLLVFDVPLTNGSALVAAEGYASPLLGPLLRSPLDLLLTTLAAAHVLFALLVRAARIPVPRASPLRLLGFAALGLPLWALPFGWMAATASSSALDLASLTLVPRSAAHLAVQVALLLALAMGGAALAALLSCGGPLPSSRGGRAWTAFGFLALAALAWRFWPRHVLGLPLLPALTVFGLAQLAAATRAAWQPRLARAGAWRRAGAALLSVALGALLLHPSLVHYGERERRRRIQRDDAPLILRQPEWIDYALQQTQRRIDELDLLERSYPAPHPAGVEELAFAVWSAGDLAAFGLSSALEIQDADGRSLSRFALNLPSLGGPPAGLPEAPEWTTTREPLRVGSAERSVLHARRRLVYHGELHGGIHLFVGDDYRNLPFLVHDDPYTGLYRHSDAAAAPEDHELTLLVYGPDRSVRFSSAERPPALDESLAARLRAAPAGFWTTQTIDRRAHHVFLFAGRDGLYGLGYPRLGAARFAADIAEAATALTLLALALLALVMLVRTALGRDTLALPALLLAVRSRFTLRLFAAFLAVAIVPVLVLQAVVQGFVSQRLDREAEDQAVERASVAQKAVEDLVDYQRRDDDRGRRVSDEALVWIGSLIRADLDLFEHGLLLASSKRELYASGLLPARISGGVYRDLVLHGRARVLSAEEIGGSTYRVVSVPVRLEGREPGILRVPLALRRRELQSVREDLDRALRLASVLFVLAAAALAQSMARRISGPVRALTAATRRVAGGDLQARVAAQSRDELRELVESFNQMAADLDRQRRDLERSNRLAAWAELARQVAHEVKNPLTPIQLSAEHLRRVYADPGVDFKATLEACTQTILKQVRTLRGIVTEFSAFARPPAPELERVDPATLVREAARPYSGALPAGLQLVLDLHDPCPAVRADRRLLERAVVNLIENALQALEGSGSLTLRLRARPEPARVEIEVEDSGPGVAPEMRARVFEPFFSSKVGGSGLGLALVKKIAEDHGGGVELESRPGRTCARIWLPAAPDA